MKQINRARKLYGGPQLACSCALLNFSTAERLNVLTFNGVLRTVRATMPTEKPRKQITITEEELHRIETLRLDLQSPARRGTPRALPLKVGFSEFVVKLAIERADQIEAELRAERAPRKRS